MGSVGINLSKSVCKKAVLGGIKKVASKSTKTPKSCLCPSMSARIFHYFTSLKKVYTRNVGDILFVICSHYPFVSLIKYLQYYDIAGVLSSGRSKAQWIVVTKNVS